MFDGILNPSLWLIHGAAEALSNGHSYTPLPLTRIARCNTVQWRDVVSRRNTPGHHVWLPFLKCTIVSRQPLGESRHLFCQEVKGARLPAAGDATFASSVLQGRQKAGKSGDREEHGNMAAASRSTRNTARFSCRHSNTRRPADALSAMTKLMCRPYLQCRLSA